MGIKEDIAGCVMWYLDEPKDIALLFIAYMYNVHEVMPKW